MSEKSKLAAKLMLGYWSKYMLGKITKEEMNEILEVKLKEVYGKQ